MTPTSGTAPSDAWDVERARWNAIWLQGLERQLVVGKHSGSHTIYYKFQEFGIELTQEEVQDILALAREMAVDLKRALFDKELSLIHI